MGAEVGEAEECDRTTLWWVTLPEELGEEQVDWHLLQNDSLKSVFNASGY